MRNCVECGSDLPASTKRRKYCSTKCSDRADNRRRIDKRMEERGRARLVGLCRTCGAEFKKTSPASAFCSEECRQQGKSNVTPYNDIYRLKRYGLTQEEYEALLVRSGGCCEICGVPEVSAPKGRLHIDHCHSTGKVRGLLCQRCNHGLGHFGDDPQALIKAVLYLQR